MARGVGAGSRGGEVKLSHSASKWITAACVLVGLGTAMFLQQRIASRNADWRIESLLGGGTGVACVKEPVKVTAFRLDPARFAKEGEPAIGAAPILAEFPVDAATARELSAILGDPASYDWERPGGAAAEDGRSSRADADFGLRFHKDASRVDIAVCSGPAILVVHRLGSNVLWANFTPSKERLLALRDRVFAGTGTSR